MCWSSFDSAGSSSGCPALTPVSTMQTAGASGEGTRAPVLLVHGFGQNRYAWHLPARSFANHLASVGWHVASFANH